MVLQVKDKTYAGANSIILSKTAILCLHRIFWTFQKVEGLGHSILILWVKNVTRRGSMSPIVSVSVGGITALRAWHRPTIDWLDSYPGTYIVMTAPVHVQCLSCCLCNLWEVMAVAVSVVYRTLALTPHIKTVIKVTPAPVLMGLIPCHHTWCQKCT